MLNISVLLVFVTVFSMAYGITAALSRNKIKIEKRLGILSELDTTTFEKAEERTFVDRIIKPIYQKLCDLSLRVTPKNKLDTLSKKLERAGILKNCTPGIWLVRKSLFLVCFSVLMGMLSLMIVPDIFKAFLLSVILILLINVSFSFYLSSKVDGRKRKILKDLPYTLDLITVSVEAGLSFDGAMARVINTISGELCDEFAKALKEIRMGIERKVALKRMSERCDVKELSMLLSSLIQADELGVSISSILRIQSENLREHRKQVAREKAMKAPIKMLFPLVFFIFPTIFIIILGPAVINMIKVFGGGGF